MDAGFVGERLLAKALGVTQTLEITTEANADIHVGLRARLSPIDLQTIRDIRVDCAGTSSMGTSPIVDRMIMPKPNYPILEIAIGLASCCLATVAHGADGVEQIAATAAAPTDTTPAPASHNGDWAVSENVVPLTGATSVVAQLSSTAPLSNMIGVPEKAIFVLRCSDRQLAAYVAWPQVLTISGTAFMSLQTQTMVLWRLDNAAIAVNNWDRSDEGTAAGKFTTSGAQKLIGQLLGARQMVVRMTGQVTQDAVFDLSGITPVATRVEQACGLGVAVHP